MKNNIKAFYQTIPTGRPTGTVGVIEALDLLTTVPLAQFPEIQKFNKVGN